MSRGSTDAERILVIEDSEEVAAMLALLLREQGYAVDVVADGDTGLALALERSPSVILLDLGLPGRSGLEVLAELRARTVRAPVLILTARDAVTERVAGLEAGADDYLGKPFAKEELLARVRALLRRTALRPASTVLRIGPLTIDPLAREVLRDGEIIPLTRTEYLLLEYLARNAGRVMPREAIVEHVWRGDAEIAPKLVDVYVSYIRRKLETEGMPPLIHTVRGVGYVLRAPDEESPEGGSAPS